MRLEARIFVGLVAGVAIGLLSKISGAGWLYSTVIAIEPAGTIFIRLVTMVVIPLVVSSLFVGVASLGDVRVLGRVGGRTLVWFAGTTVLAATIGLVVAVIARVGSGLDAATRDAITGRFQEQGATALSSAGSVPGFVQTLVEMVPQNPIGAAARGELLPLIVAVCLFAAAATVVDTAGKRALLELFRGVNDVSMVVIRWLMQLAPPAVFVLIAATVAKSGLDLLKSLVGYAVVVLVAMVVHLVLVLLPALRFAAHQRIAPFFRAVSDALMMAFSTASSNVTLPVSMNAARTRLGLPENVVSFVLPAGATLNKNGAAVYKAVTGVFIARLYGLDLGFAQAVTIVATSTVAAFAGAGVPGSSLVTTLIVLNALGLGAHAAAAIALVTGIDRPLDMCRTTLNTIGNLVGTAWVARKAT